MSFPAGAMDQIHQRIWRIVAAHPLPHGQSPACRRAFLVQRRGDRRIAVADALHPLRLVHSSARLSGAHCFFFNWCGSCTIADDGVSFLLLFELLTLHRGDRSFAVVAVIYRMVFWSLSNGAIET